MSAGAGAAASTLRVRVRLPPGQQVVASIRTPYSFSRAVSSQIRHSEIMDESFAAFNGSFAYLDGRPPAPPNSSAANWTRAAQPTDDGPSELKFRDNSMEVAIYGILFVVAAVGNLTVFVTLIRGRHRKSRISLMITHLSIADLCVAFIMIPMEIGWRLTTQWLAGNAACKFFLFLRAFGLYLSSNVLVCVSVDRYFAILHPLRVNDARRRGKVMLTLAWIFSFVCALPQSVVFHVAQHPQQPDFYQCVSFGSFETPSQEIAYNLLCLFAMYFLPLIVIVIAYTCILWEIFKKTRETKADQNRNCEELVRGRMRLRRSDMTNIERARARTLRMTVIIVLAFIWCWTPYVVMTLWYMFDRQSAEKVDTRLQDGLFLMAVSNSCMNPLVYGSYAMNFRQECRSCFAYFFKNSGTLDAKSTDGRNRAIFQVPMCFTMCKGGSAVTKSSAIGNHGSSVHGSRNHLVVNKTYNRPVSAEVLMIGGDSRRYGSVVSHESDEFHSEPLHAVAAAQNIYLAIS
ncbi:receptor [Nesidiocoris tenuis]|uniref:Receptor n=2 Tax=Nesidiocoris tenuis TaxID=355587 RepID=A0ABN7AS70_9HEMI|nr:receptor [Nesidiocoris tenuis]